MLVMKLKRCPVCFPCLAVAVWFGEMLFLERRSSLIYCCSSKSNGIPICAIDFSADFQILLWNNLELIFQIQRLVPKVQCMSALEIKTCLARINSCETYCICFLLLLLKRIFYNLVAELL